MKHTFVIGDIHGELDSLINLLNAFELETEEFSSQDTTDYVFLGDYVDRGPNSKGVIDFLIDFSKDNECIFLKGNHDLMFYELVLRNFPEVETRHWGIHGLDQTIISYMDSEDGIYIPSEHMEFLKNLKLYHEDDLRIYVHAGIDQTKTTDSQHPDFMLWAKKEFTDVDFYYKKYVVYGHTPYDTVRVEKYRCGLDTGSGRGGMLSGAYFNDTDPLPQKIFTV